MDEQSHLEEMRRVIRGDRERLRRRRIDAAGVGEGRPRAPLAPEGRDRPDDVDASISQRLRQMLGRR